MTICGVQFFLCNLKLSFATFLLAFGFYKRQRHNCVVQSTGKLECLMTVSTTIEGIDFSFFSFMTLFPLAISKVIAIGCETFFP